MKISYASDIHLEYREYKIHPSVTGDVLVLAGDIVQINQLREKHVYAFFKQATSQFTNVIYVPGNHEYYEGELKDIHKLKNFYEFSNLHVLHNSCKVIDGVQFIGGTGWTSFNGLDALTMKEANRMISDFRKIKKDGVQFSTYNWLEEHSTFVNFLKTVDFNPYRNVVVTHHSPTALTASEQHKDDFESNGCYCADLLKYTDNVSYWIYGHAHDGLDIEYNGCKIISNIRGYPNEEIFNSFAFKSVEI